MAGSGSSRDAVRPHAESGAAGSMPRVAAVMSIENVSGPGRQLAAVARELRGRGIEFRVLLLHRRGHPRPPFADYLEAAGIPNTIIADDGPMDIRLPGRAAAVLRSWSTDVVQTHGYKATAVAWALRLRGRATRWIGFFHGSTTESARACVYHWADRRMLRAADRVVVMSEKHRREFARCGERVRVIHNAVIALPEHPSAEEEARIAAIAREATPPLVGVVGRLSPEKGVDVFIDACAEVARAGVQFTALIAGDGPQERALRDRCAAHGLESRVKFLGHLHGVDRLYPHLDVLAIPSRSEGLPNVLLEALAADVRVVATSVGAIPEVLRDPAAGTLVPPADVAGMARALTSALTTRQTVREVAARAETVERFSLARRADAHIAMYGEVHARPHADIAAAAPARVR